MNYNKIELEKLCEKEKCQSYFILEEKHKKAVRVSKKLDTVLDSSYDGIYITDGNAVTLRVNKAYERITGISATKIIGKTTAYLEKQGLISKSCSLIALENKKVTTIQQKLATGKVVLVTATPIFDDLGDVEMIVANVRDITELIKLREAIQKKDKKVDDFNSEIHKLKEALNKKNAIIARDANVKKLLISADRIASHDTTVLISGETGTGKEVFAEYIHNNSSRKNKKLVKVNCGAIPETLIESELFGYEKGAFTGANNKGKIGLFEEANGGTIFLDEIGELPMSMQAKLLRVIQEREIQRIGGVETTKIDVRIITATNKNLAHMSDMGDFRKDLFYRLNIIPLEIPPLRLRRDDIVPLVDSFKEKLNEKYSGNKKFSKEVYEIFLKYNWPGNIRELKNVVERIYVMSNTDFMDIEDVPNEVYKEKNKNSSSDSMSLKEAVSDLEYKMLCKAFAKHGNVRCAAKELEIDASTFVRKRQKYEKALSKK
jgi:PAS domain S-box-containing protein